MTVDNNSQATVTNIITQNGRKYIKSGSKDQ